jgi:hypothetical protein
MQMTRLNVFQRLVRQWDQLHPYNAAQVLRIRGRADVGRIQQAWIDTISIMGLGKLRLSGNRFAYESLNGSAGSFGVRCLASSTRLEDFISEQLNEPFGEDDVFPFRPFLLEQDDSHYMGVVYQHWVADSVSIRLLLKDWFARLFDPPAARTTRVRLPSGGYWRHFAPDRAGWQLGEGFLSSVRWSSRFKRVRRIETPAFSDFRVRFSLHRAGPGWIDRLHRATRPRGLTLNDVFLASIAQACDRHVPVQMTPKRHDLALGSIVDLRAHTSDDLTDVFGLFLGFTSVIFSPSDLADFERLLRCVGKQTALHKRSGVPQASAIRMLAGIVAGRLLGKEDTITFYRKRVPLAGGISNVNMNRSWAARYHPDPLREYIRVSPTGPMMPLVFTTTTLGNEFHFGLTRRASLIDDARAAALAGAFMNRLDQLIASP